MKDERPCLDSLDRYLDQNSPSRSPEHSCPDCKDLPNLVSRLRQLETACSQPGDDALTKAVMEKAQSIAPMPRPKGWFLPAVITAALVGGAAWYALRTTHVSVAPETPLNGTPSPASSAFPLNAGGIPRDATSSSLLPHTPIESTLSRSDKHPETASSSPAVTNENTSTIEIADPDGLPR